MKIIFDDGDHQYPAVNSGGWDFSSDAVYDENGKTSDTNTSLNKFIIADSSTVPSDISSLSSFLSNKLSDDASFSGNETTSFSQAASQLETLSNFYNSETDSSNTYRVLSSSGEDVTSNSTISSSYSSSDNYTEIFDITSFASSAAVVSLQPTDNGTNEITKLKVEVPSDSSGKIYIVINWPQDNYNFDSGSLTIDNSFPANRVINNFYNLTSDLSSPDITSNAISIDSGHGINFGTILAPHNNVKLNSDTSADVNVATGGILTLNCDTLNPSNQFAITNFPKLDVIPTINSVEFEGNDTTSSDRTVSTSGSSATLTGATYGENIFADITTAGSTSDYTLYEKLNDGNWTAVNDDPSKVKLSSQDDFNKNIFTFNSGTDTSTNSKIIGGTLQRSNTVKFEWAKNIPTDDTNAFTATVTEENDLSATVPTTIDFGSIALGATSWSSISNNISSSISIKNGWDFPIGIAILNVTAGSSLTNEGTTSTIDITDIAKALQMSSFDSTSSSWDNTASSYSYDISDISSSIDFPLRIAFGNLSSASLKEVSVGTTYEIPLTWTITVNPLSSSSS